MRYAATILILLLAALPGPASGQQPPPAPQLPEVRAVVLRSMAPFFSVGPDNLPHGFAVDATRAIAELAGLRVTFLVADDWAEAQRDVLEGRAAFMAGMTATPERKRHFVFTSPIFVSPSCLMVRANDKTIREPADLRGRTLAILRGSLIPEPLRHVPEVWIREYTSPQHYILDLLSGNVDAVMAGRYELAHLTSQAGVDNLVDFVDGPGTEYKRRLALAAGDQELAARLDAAVRRFTSSPQYPELVERWYGRPRPFWTAARVIALTGAALACAILAALAIHYHLTLRLNARLAAALQDSRRNADQLARNRDMFRHLVENIRHVFWMRDLETGGIIYVSPAYEDLSGKSTQTLYDEPGSFLDMVHPDDRERVERATERLHKDGTPFDMEMRVCATRGGERWVSARAFRLAAADNLPPRTVGFLEDITAAKTASLTLQESESLFRALFMDSSVVMLLLDPETGRIAEANHSASAYYGWSRDELMAMNVTDINTLPPRELRKIMDRTSSEGRGRYFFRHRLANGETRDVEVHSGPVAMQGRQVLHSCVIDVTERRQAQELLRRSEDFQRAIVACSPVALYSMDLEGCVLSWNASAERIFGWRTDEVLGTPLPIIGPDEQPEFTLLRARALAGERLVGLELTRRHKNGSRVEISLSTAVIRGDDGVPIGILGAAQDITARKRAEREMLQAKEAAEAASQAKSEFLANMSHEIRTPLNGLMGMLQLLESTALEAEQGEYVELAKQSCTRLTRLLSDILDLSRVEAGKLSIQAKPFSLADTLDQLKGIFRPLARQSGLEFICHVGDDVPETVVGDEVRLMQVLMNLLGNAFKFTTAGKVTLEAYSLPPRGPGQLRVLFSVADTGIGIPGEDIARLFKPFSQVSEGFTRRYQGAGLGLVICKRLVELMGGSIAVDSEPGAGTTMLFCCTFQAHTQPAAQVPPQAPGPGPGLGGARVLVAEDDRVNGLAAARMLEKAGARPTVVGDGSQALAALRDDPFDLVLMDVQMPVMDGVEATRAIREGRAGEAARAVPIVAMTAYAMAGDKEAFLAAGMDGYVSKPVDPDELAHAVETALGGARG